MDKKKKPLIEIERKSPGDRKNAYILYNLKLAQACKKGGKS